MISYSIDVGGSSRLVKALYAKGTSFFTAAGLFFPFTQHYLPEVTINPARLSASYTSCRSTRTVAFCNASNKGVKRVSCVSLGDVELRNHRKSSIPPSTSPLGTTTFSALYITESVIYRFLTLIRVGSRKLCRGKGPVVDYRTRMCSRPVERAHAINVHGRPNSNREHLDRAAHDVRKKGLEDAAVVSDRTVAYSEDRHTTVEHGSTTKEMVFEGIFKGAKAGASSNSHC